MGKGLLVPDEVLQGVNSEEVMKGEGLSSLGSAKHILATDVVET